jgi:hypothetical protein
VSNLAINTPKGQASTTYEATMIASLKANFPSFDVVKTETAGHDASATIDGLISKNGILKYIFESKCRYTDAKQMLQWNNEWLVTYDKIKKAADMASLLKVPFIGLLWLTKEPYFHIVKICDQNGNFIPKIRVEQTLTTATCNGGQIIKPNAFIDITGATTLPIIGQTSNNEARSQPTV